MEKDVINILIVDDEKYEGILMEKSVAWESEGFHIMGNVQCAEDALALMEKQTPDIVYTDINMPRIDGLELSRRIRETYPAVHIVIVTGYREFEYAREAIHIGVEEFLLKPIQSDELLDAALAATDMNESYSLWQQAQEDVGPDAEALWVWFANVDHLYFARDGLAVAEQKLHPHGHGWSLVNNVDQWTWE